MQETFIKGGGKGGQKINKTSSCVHLVHIPSGVSVKNQDTRYLHANRKIARKILRDKLDVIVNQDMSEKMAKVKRARERAGVKRRKQNRDRRDLQHLLGIQQKR